MRIIASPSLPTILAIRCAGSGSPRKRNAAITMASPTAHCGRYAISCMRAPISRSPTGRCTARSTKNSRTRSLTKSAIVARSLEIPAVVGLEDVTARAQDGDAVILAGGRPFVENPELARQLGADGTAADGAQAARMVEKIRPKIKDKGA